MITQKGQSLIELVVAMTIFVLVASTIAFLVIDVYVSDRAGQERTEATFLAEEGLEQARLVRDNNWDNLVSVPPETISKFTRTIVVEDLDSNRKRVTCSIDWNLTENRSQNVSLVTYLTDWQSLTAVVDCNSACVGAGYSSGSCSRRRFCSGTVLGSLGEYECSRWRVCCCIGIGGSDNIPPANIIDLFLSNASLDSIDLSWTAPGDDGSTGTASSYDIRYSTSLITSANWASATSVSGEPSPSSSGSPESMTVDGLSPGITYYFAIKTSDEVPNESGISNVLNLTTLIDCNSACIGASYSSGSCSRRRFCSGMILGSLGEYECSRWRVCCCI